MSLLLLGSAVRRARGHLQHHAAAALAQASNGGSGGVVGSVAASADVAAASCRCAGDPSPSGRLRAPFAAAPTAASVRWTFTAPSPTKLDEIMHVDQLSDKTAEEIEQIWLQFHEEGTAQGAGRVADTLGADEYRQLSARARSSPMFVLPLSKPGGGFLTLLLNWQGRVALLTSLDEYRRFGAGAPPHLSVTFYDELADSKGIVLARGDVVNDRVVSVAEARTLLQLARAFYTDPGAHRHVYRFNHEPDAFSFDELLAELGVAADRKSDGGGGGVSGSGAGSGGSGGVEGGR